MPESEGERLSVVARRNTTSRAHAAALAAAAAPQSHLCIAVCDGGAAPGRSALSIHGGERAERECRRAVAALPRRNGARSASAERRGPAHQGTVEPAVSL